MSEDHAGVLQQRDQVVPGLYLLMRYSTVEKQIIIIFIEGAWTEGMETEIRQRIRKLREYLLENGIDVFLFPTADYHASEYVAPFFRTREYFCGFTGSAGTLLVSAQEALLWTDGRYFIQAARELEGSGVKLMKMLEPGVPTLMQYLKDNVPEGAVLGFDGRCMTAGKGREFISLAQKCSFSLRTDLDPAEAVWTDRPQMPCSEAFIHHLKYVGESPSDRLARLRKDMTDRGVSTYLDSKLDNIMWLLSLRGADVECNPVVLSHLMVDPDHAHLFVQEKAVTEQVRSYLSGYGVTVHPYDSFDRFLSKYEYKGDVACDPDCVSIYYSGIASAAAEAAGYSAGFCASPIISFKSVKNPTELTNLRDCYRRDSAAVCRFIKWVQEEVRRRGVCAGTEADAAAAKDAAGTSARPLTETAAAACIDSLRAEIPDFQGLSFGTISAYGANAAMMHYQAVPGGSDAVLQPEGMLLVDSGGQYLSGTTDVTRTTALGPVTEQMRRHYTLTAVSNLQLMGAVFMEGCTGAQLDMLARVPMWKQGLDYKCGTGHGIGYFLNVHEAPPTIRWGNTAGQPNRELKPGMIVSDEPGVYLEGQYGIRIETILEVVEHSVTACGHFLAFSPLTLVPFDRDLLEPRWMTEESRELLDAYHARVYEEIAPLLSQEDREWLKVQTAPLS